MLEKLLRSLEHIALDEARYGALEVIIVDNAPTGAARAVCEKVAPVLPVALHFAEEAERGLSFARNRAVDEALARDADFVAFVDDDDLPESDWLLRLLEKQAETGCDVIYGVWETIRHDHLPDWLKNVWMFKPKAAAVDQKNIHGVPVLAGTCNVLVSRDILRKLAETGAVFSPEFAAIGGEGMDFFIRARQLGADSAVAEKSIVNRDHEAERLTFRGILKRNFHNGHVQMVLAKKHCSAEQIRDLRKDSLRILKKNLAGLLKHGLSKTKSANRFMRISYALGRMHAWFGGGFDYYR